MRTSPLLSSAAICIGIACTVDARSPQLSASEADFISQIFVALGLPCPGYRVVEGGSNHLASSLGVDGNTLVDSIEEVVKLHKGITYDPSKNLPDVDREGMAALTRVGKIVSANPLIACEALGNAYIATGLLTRCDPARLKSGLIQIKTATTTVQHPAHGLTFPSQC
jgi:hypothetical protein